MPLQQIGSRHRFVLFIIMKIQLKMKQNKKMDEKWNKYGIIQIDFQRN